MLALILVILAVTVAAAPLADRLLGRNAGWLLSLPLIASAILGVMAYQPTASGGGGEPHAEAYPWAPTIGAELSLRFDGLSFVFLMLILVIGAGIMMYSTRYLGVGHNVGFWFFLTGFAAAMTLLVLTDDLVMLYIAWELTTLCSFFLIAMTGGFNGRAPAIRTLLVTVFGGLMLLTAIVIMVATMGTTSISQIISSPQWDEHPGLLVTVAVFVAIAAFTKSAQFPFQAWLPDSMAAISPVSAYLHAATMVKAGIYLMLRFSPMFEPALWWSILLIFSGGFTAIFGAVTAVKRDDLKEVLAYSTMSQLGLITFTIGLNQPLALKAALVHTVAHAVFKATLFMIIGIVDVQAGTRRFSKLRGKNLRMPVTKTLVTIAGLSMAGLPPLFGFVSKELIIEAMVDADVPDTDFTLLLTGVVMLTSVFTFVYSAKIIMGVFGRRKKENPPPGVTDEPVTEASVAFWLVPALLAGVTVVFGVVPHLLDGIISDALFAVTGDIIDPQLALWHGFNLPLLLTTLIILAGLVLVYRINTVQGALRQFMAPVSGLNVVENLRAGIITAGSYVTRTSGTTSMRRHLAAPMTLLVLLAFVGLFTVEPPPLAGDPSRDYDWIVTGLIAVGVLAAIRANTRLTMVIVLSIVGFAVTLWFYSLGAADVATTQLTVEILTVVVMVLVLQRLPNKMEKDTPTAEIFSFVLAAALGIATSLGVWALTGRREKSDVAEYYLREGENLTGGSNIVNTILVDFRALDTYGELTVLGVAGLVVAVLLSKRPLNRPVAISLDTKSPVLPPVENSVYLRTAFRIIGPLVIAMSALLFFRGHYETGGGFVAALVGGAGLALYFLAAPSDPAGRIKMSYSWLIGLGIVVGAVTGLFGFLHGSFLAPFDINLGFTTIPSTLIFDFGVYLAVIGVVVAAINLLGTPDTRGESGDDHAAREAARHSKDTREVEHSGQPERSDR